MALIRDRDAADNREALQNILVNVENIKEVFSLAQPGVENIMQRIHEVCFSSRWEPCRHHCVDPLFTNAIGVAATF